MFFFKAVTMKDTNYILTTTRAIIIAAACLRLHVAVLRQSNNNKLFWVRSGSANIQYVKKQSDNYWVIYLSYWHTEVSVVAACSNSMRLILNMLQDSISNLTGLHLHCIQSGSQTFSELNCMTTANQAK